jgi:hypothetical protein
MRLKRSELEPDRGRRGSGRTLRSAECARSRVARTRNRAFRSAEVPGGASHGRGIGPSGRLNVSGGASRERGIGISGELIGRGWAICSPKPDSCHTDTISTTLRARRASWNAMKPRIQCVLTQWNPGFTASGRRLAGVWQASGSGPNGMNAHRAGRSGMGGAGVTRVYCGVHAAIHTTGRVRSRRGAVRRALADGPGRDRCPVP